MINQLNESDNKGDTSLRNAVSTIVSRISDSLPDLKEPVKMFLAGDLAVNFYTGYIPTTDFTTQATFSRRLLINPNDLIVSFVGSNQLKKIVYFDANYNTNFSLIHPDFENDSFRVLGDEFKSDKLQLHLISPVDLVLSKLARFKDNDREHVIAFALDKLVTTKLLNSRANEALECHLGNTDKLLFNLKEASKRINEAHRDKDKSVGNYNAR